MDFSKLLNGFVKIDTWISVRDGFLRKTCCSFGFCPKEGAGGESPFQNFCHLYNQDTLFLTITTVDDAFKFPS